MESSSTTEELQSDEDYKSPVSPVSASSADVTFEGQWEEDDLMALSGIAGQSFQKLHTRSQKVAQRNQSSRNHSDSYQFTHSVSDFSEFELDDTLNSEELMSPDAFDSSMEESSPQHSTGIELEWDNDTPVHKPQSEEDSPTSVNHSMWKTVVIGEKNFKLDLSAITPYKNVLSHGGYYGEGLNAIVVFSACYLPDTRQSDYRYIMDNLFLYIVSSLDLLVAEDYLIIFFNGGCSRKNFPSFKWLKKCYQMIHRRLRKNLKQLIVVHPSWYIRLLIGFFRPFISSKFSRKLKFTETLHRLADIVPLDSVVVPDPVQQHDVKLQQRGRTNSDPKTIQKLSETAGRSNMQLEI